MSTTTKKMGLIKPDMNDAADITMFNANWDKLDNLKDSTIEQKPLCADGEELSTLLESLFESMPSFTTKSICVEFNGGVLQEGVWMFQIHRDNYNGAVVGNLLWDYSENTRSKMVISNITDNGQHPLLGSWTHVCPQFTYGTDDVTEGSVSNKPDGTIYFVIE